MRRGWSVNGLLAGGLLSWLRDGGVPPPRLVSAATTMPFVLLLTGVTGLRAALMLPQDPRANWIFRLREDEEHRPAQLDAVERLFMRLVVWPVLVCVLPLQWALLGADALVGLPIAYLAGVILVELVIRTWRRIPVHVQLYSRQTQRRADLPDRPDGVRTSSRRSAPASPRSAASTRRAC